MRLSLTAHRRLFTALSLAVACAALASCAANYVEPTSGPYAYVRITDAWPAPMQKKDLLGNETLRVTQAWIFPSSAECGHHDFVRTPDWIRVRADQEFVVRQALPEGVPGRLECAIKFAGKLQEGQRVTYRFDARRTPGTAHDGTCDVTATDAAGAPLPTNSDALHAAPASCSFTVL